MDLPQLPGLQRVCLSRNKRVSQAEGEGRGGTTGVLGDFELFLSSPFPLLPANLASGFLGMGKRGFLAILHIDCFARAEHSRGLGFPQLLEELGDTRDGFFCDAVYVLASWADVGKWWSWCKELEQIRGEEVSARHLGCRW